MVGPGRHGCQYDCEALLRGHPAEAGCVMLDPSGQGWRTANGVVSTKLLFTQLSASAHHTIVQGRPPQLASFRYEVRANSRSWVNAEADCVMSGGHLASVHSVDDELRLLEGYDNGHFWIGLNDRRFEMGCDGGDGQGPPGDPATDFWVDPADTAGTDLWHLPGAGNATGIRAKCKQQG